jgi:hypothetical protein
MLVSGASGFKSFFPMAPNIYPDVLIQCLNVGLQATICRESQLCGGHNFNRVTEAQSGS